MGEGLRTPVRKMTVEDSVFIRNLTMPCKVGVPNNERRRDQEIVVDLTVYCDLRKAGVSDDIRKTVSYSKLKESVVEFASKGDFRLLEAVAEGVASLVLRDRTVRRVTVAVRKRRFGRAPAVGVEITRRQHG
jgi:FolB domain-containing protein